MKAMAVAVMSAALLATPALAQQQQPQQGNAVGNLLENLGRSLNGQENPSQPQGNDRQTYDETSQQYRSESKQQLQQDNQRLEAARNRIDAALASLHQEMTRRGIAAGSNGEGYGSSTPPENSQNGSGYNRTNGGNHSNELNSGSGYSAPNKAEPQQR
jgi:opacity protein-like surface antigen